MNYQDKNDQEPDTYVKGIRILDENGHHPYEYYVRDEQENFILCSKKDETNSYLYDDKGRVEEYQDLSTNIIYDYEGNEIAKEMFLWGDNIFISQVPIDVADEIQAHLDQNQGNSK